MGKLVLFESAVDVRTELNLLSQGIRQHFSSDELTHIKDLQKFVLKKEDGWVLDKHLHSLVSKILADPGPDYVAMKVSVLRLFSVCALRENFVHFLNLDRQDRILMNYAATDFSSRSLNEQKALTLFFCNLFSTQSRRWLLYFSEWTSEEGELTSNAQITCTLAGKAMNNLNPQTQLYASGIVFNLSAVDFGFTESLDVLIEPLCPEEQPMGGSVNEERICHLKAHNKIFLQICMSTFDTIKRKLKTLQEDILWNYLQTLDKLLPNIREDFLLLYPDAEMDVENLAKNNLSQRNLSKLNSIANQLQISSITNGDD